MLLRLPIRQSENNGTNSVICEKEEEIKFVYVVKNGSTEPHPALAIGGGKIRLHRKDARVGSFCQNFCYWTRGSTEKSSLILLHDLKEELLDDVTGTLRIEEALSTRTALKVEVRGSDGRTLYGSRLEGEKELFMYLDNSDLDHKRPFYYDVTQGKPFIFTSEASRVLTQIELLLIFMRGRGQLWTLEEYWTQVGVLTGHSSSSADFNWGASHISVGYVLNVYTVVVRYW